MGRMNYKSRIFREVNH